MTEGYVYIIELAKPLGTAKHSARYYLGFTRYPEERFAYHCKGQGANFTRAAAEKGIPMKMVVLLKGSSELEQKLKAEKNTARIVRRYINSPANLINA